MYAFSRIYQLHIGARAFFYSLEYFVSLFLFPDQNLQIKGSSSMSKYTTMPPTEMSNCEAGVGGIHCHTATARAKELSQQSANATHRLRIAAVLCIFFIAGEVRNFSQ